MKTQASVKAAIDFHSSQAVGLDGAFGRVDHARCGAFLLGFAAAGLAFGTYSLGDARHCGI